MPVLSRIVSVVLRIGEIGFAAIVAGVVGDYLHDLNDGNITPNGRWIYTEVIAGVSMLLALLWLIPFSAGFVLWPLDLLISLAWFASFGLFVDTISDMSCGGTFDWDFDGFWDHDFCARWKAATAFAFLSAIFWLVSMIVGIWFTYRTRTRPVAGDGLHHHRKPWYRVHNGHY